MRKGEGEKRKSERKEFNPNMRRGKKREGKRYPCANVTSILLTSRHTFTWKERRGKNQMPGKRRRKGGGRGSRAHACSLFLYSSLVSKGSNQKGRGGEGSLGNAGGKKKEKGEKMAYDPHQHLMLN